MNQSHTGHVRIAPDRPIAREGLVSLVYQNKHGSQAADNASNFKGMRLLDPPAEN